MTAPTTLINTRRWGVPGVNYYYINAPRKNITLDELAAVGIVDDATYVHVDLIVPLVQAQTFLMRHGFGIFLEDAFRSPETYELAYRKTAEQEGEEVAKRLFNLEFKPHATARAIDVALIDLQTGKKLWLRNDAVDGLEAKFVGFYDNRQDAEALTFRLRQDILREAMFDAGFVFGSKLEVWHFELP